MKSSLLPALCALLFLLPASAADMKDVPHPFLIWTKADIAEMRSRMKSDPEFQKQIENYMALEARPPKAGGNPDLLALIKYTVLEDKAAGEGQKKALLKFIDLKMPEAGGDNPEARNSRHRAALPQANFPRHALQSFIHSSLIYENQIFSSSGLPSARSHREHHPMAHTRNRRPAGAPARL